NRDGFLDTGRRALASVSALVTSSNREGHASFDAGLDRVVDRLVNAATEAHVRHGRAVSVLSNPVDAVDNLLGRAGAVVVKHADTNDGRGLRQTVLGASRGTRDVRTVAVAVSRVFVADNGVVARSG